MTGGDSALAEAARRRLIAGALSFETLPKTILARLATEAELVVWPAGSIIYEPGSAPDDIFIVVEGGVWLEAAEAPAQFVRAGEAFGWMAFAPEAARRNRAVTASSVRLLRFSGQRLVALLGSGPRGEVVRKRIEGALSDIRQAPPVPRPPGGSLARVAHYAAQWLRSPAPYLMLIGYALLLGFWYIAVQVLQLPRFRNMPGLTGVFAEWFSRNPVYGISVFTPAYYQHILVSLRRIFIAFGLATALGVPTGLFLGWSQRFRDYVFPVFELLRPIPPLAWVPLAIVMLPGSELPVIYLTFLASFFATALNTKLGVNSIDPVYIQAASCLGATRWRIFFSIIIPGALPHIFTGLQISIGVAWFSLVAAEMVSGQFGLGYLINTSYTTVQYPTMIIAMLTLGIVGYATSALVRLTGHWLVAWRGRQRTAGAGL